MVKPGFPFFLRQDDPRRFWFWRIVVAGCFSKKRKQKDTKNGKTPNAIVCAPGTIPGEIYETR